MENKDLSVEERLDKLANASLNLGDKDGFNDVDDDELDDEEEYESIGRLGRNKRKNDKKLSFKSNLNSLSINAVETDITKVANEAMKVVQRFADQHYGKQITPHLVVLEYTSSELTVAYSTVVISITAKPREDAEESMTVYCPIIVEGQTQRMHQLKANAALNILRQKDEETRINRGLESDERINLEIELAVPSDAFDKFLAENIETFLYTKIPSFINMAKHKFFSVDCITLPRNVENQEEKLKQLILMSMNKLIAFVSACYKLYDEVNLRDYFSSDRYKKTKLSTSLDYSGITVYDIVNRPYNAPIITDITLSGDADENYRESINYFASDTTLCRIASYIDYSSEMIDIRTKDGEYEERVRMRGDLVLTHISSDEDTMGRLLLGVATAAAVNMNETGYLNAIWRNNHCDVGALNVITKSIATDNKGNYGVINISSASKAIKSADDISKIVKAIVPYHDGVLPRLSLDILIGGDHSSFVTTVLLAGMYNCANSKELILDTVRRVTGTEEKFDGDIFLTNYKVLPYGYIQDKNGNTIDARAIDLPTIINTVGNNADIEEFVIKYLYTNSDQCEPLEAYYNRLEILGELCPDAIIAGKLVRLTFSPEFLEFLNAALMDANIKYKVTYPLVPNENDLSINHFSRRSMDRGGLDVTSFSSSVSFNRNKRNRFDNTRNGFANRHPWKNLTDSKR